MMHGRCGSCSSHGNMLGFCSTCGLHNSQRITNDNNNSYDISLLFNQNNWLPYHQHHLDQQEEERPPAECSFYPNFMDDYSSSSPVDCTLSLATPSSSTRASCGDFAYDSTQSYHPPPQSGYYGWDFLGTASKYSAAPSDEPSNTCRGASRGTGSNNAAGYNISSPSSDPLLARRCANCDTTSTPLWRNGPRGPKSLCNACGIRFKKEERRAFAAAASNSGATSGTKPARFS